MKGDGIRTEVKTIYIDDLCVDEEVYGRHLGQIIMGQFSRQKFKIFMMN